ncbi:MAG: LptF/LptG family permease [Opitutaceae bacterium]
MLKLLHRHILKEIFVSTCLAMGLFIFVLLVGNILRDAAGLLAAGKLEIATFLKLIGYLIPYVASYALPLGMLTGTLIALGRLSSQQEIVAMKAAGISLYQIASPVFLISFIGMLMAVVVNLHYGPQSRVASKQLVAEAITNNPVGFIEEKRFINEFPGYVIYMGDRDGSTMKDFWVWELDEEKRVQRFVRAEEGELRYDRAANELVLDLKNSVAEIRSETNQEAFNTMPEVPSFGELSLALPLDQVFGEKGKKRRVKTKELTFSQLMDRREKALEAEAISGEGMSEDRLNVQVHLQKNFAMAFSVFSLAIFGVPLAIQVGRKETYANLAIAIVISMTYYFLMIIVSWMEGNPALRADILIWIPNIVFQGVGFWLMRRASRH